MVPRKHHLALLISCSNDAWSHHPPSKVSRTLINPDATRYPWTRIPPGACDSLRLGLCNGKPHTASRMNIADIMLLYFITRVHRMRYATVRSRVSCISPCRPCTRPHTYSVGHACEPPPSHRPSVLYILLYAARFRLPPVPFRNITLRASSWFSRVSKHAVIKGLHWRVPATGSASESASV